VTYFFSEQSGQSYSLFYENVRTKSFANFAVKPHQQFLKTYSKNDLNLKPKKGIFDIFNNKIVKIA
jgi:hypothetical protein